MLTVDQIEEWEEKKGKILVVVETMQFFEIEIDADQDPEAFIDSEECRKECADRILNQTTDLMLDRVYRKYNPENHQWEEEEA